jgi:hypothetical protein
MFLTIPFNMFYYIALKYGNLLLETLDTFPLLKDAYIQPRQLYENRISSWYGALQQILNNIPRLKQLSTNQKVSKQTVQKILPEAHRHQWALDRNKCSDGKLRTYGQFKTVYAMHPQYWSRVVRVSSTNPIPYASDAMIGRCRSTMRRLANLKR